MHELKSRSHPTGSIAASTWLPIVAVIWTVGCDSPAGLPEMPAMTEVQGVDFRELSLHTRDGGWGTTSANVMEISAIPADQNYILGANERIRVVVGTEGGDREELMLGPKICPVDEIRYFCTRLTVLSEQGVRPEPLAEAAAYLGAKIFFPRICSSLTGDCGDWDTGVADVQVADFSQLQTAASVLRWVPEVRAVGRSVSGTLQMGPPSYPVVGYFALVDQTAVAQEDGVIQAPPGDSILVTTLDGRRLQAFMKVGRNVEVTVR